MTKTRRLNFILGKTWKLKAGTMKINDWVFNINFHGKSPADLAQIQVSMDSRQMTKRELFKHLIWRIWHEK